ncbi:MAG TPA: hypothetical protein VGC13_29395 [Longimicrobium sp.]|jgi:hypothetical protein
MGHPTARIAAPDVAASRDDGVLDCPNPRTAPASSTVPDAGGYVAG